MDTINTLGRRKTSVARVYLSKGKGNISVNKRDYKDYFKTIALQYNINQPFEITDTLKQYDVKANVKGGGISGQAEALRLGIARALVQVNPEYRPMFKEGKLLTRDPRMVERKKPGQKKARKRFQFSKR